MSRAPLVGALSAFALLVPAPAHAQCVAMISLHGVAYLGARALHPAPVGRTAVTATEPGCNDTVPANPAPPHHVQVHAVRGVPLAFGFIDPEGPNYVYVSPLYLVALRSHPLHRFVFAGDQPHLLGPRCGRAFTVAGHVRIPSSFEVDLQTRRHALLRVKVDARTAMAQSLQPLRRGRHLVVRVRTCGRSLVAIRIRAL